MVVCLQRGADLHMAQLMPLPLAVSCFSKIQTSSTFLVPAHPGSPGKGPLNGRVLLVCSFCVLLPKWQTARVHCLHSKLTARRRDDGGMKCVRRTD